MTPSPAKRLRLLRARAERITALRRRNDAAIDAVLRAIEAKRWEARDKELERWCRMLGDANQLELERDRARMAEMARERICKVANRCRPARVREVAA